MKKPPLPLRMIRGVYRWFFGVYRSQVYGEARFMDETEKNSLLTTKNTGLSFSEKDRLPLNESFEHSVTLAPTGKGKTNRFIIPNILNCEGSMVITDPSGEIYQKTSGYLSQKGYKIQVLNPLDLKQSNRFNPLLRMKSYQQLKQIALNLVNQKLGSNTDFWSANAAEQLFLVLQAQKKYLPEYNNLANTRWILNNFHDEEKMNAFMAKVFHSEPFILAEYESFISNDEKVKSSVLATTKTALDLFTDPDIRQLTATDNMEIEKLRSEKTAIYLIVPERKVSYYALLLNLFYFTCFETFSDIEPGKEDLPIFFFMDEFGNMGQIYEFDKIATTIRKRKCSLNIILQTKRQLRQNYGDDGAYNIYEGGMGTKIFFRGLDQEGCEYLSKILGSNTVYDTEFGGVSEKARVVSQPLMTADQIRMMASEEAVIIRGSEKPVKMTMPFYQNTRLYKHSKITPHTSQYPDQDKTIQLIPFDDFIEDDN